MDIKLTQFSHGGGCGCKIAPAILSELLANSPIRNLPKALLVGTESSDDAAVYQLNDEQAIIATTDFFTPIVDNPFDFGRIAATNAISDIYAMGGQPIMALALVGMPLDKLPIEVIRDILAGGESVCADAGIPIAGGHSIDVLEPIYGLVALGVVHPKKVKRNNQAKAGDKIILGKPLGVGILSAALKKGILSDQGYAEMIRYTTQLNQVGIKLSNVDDVHALTDVTGFGLAGHLLEICRGSNLSAEINFSSIPMIAEALPHVQAGIFTGASTRNWAGYGKDVLISGASSAEISWQQQMITDPQTSGGLLVACSPESEQEVLDLFHTSGFGAAQTIGQLVSVKDTPTQSPQIKVSL
jgi:selenide,water dikinase